VDQVDRPTASAAELTGDELAAGGERVRSVLARYRPACAAYTGKGVYRAAAGRAAGGYGRMAPPVVAGVTDFVLPSPSGRSGLPWGVKVAWYRELAALLPPVPR
jgi:TDG/mug DNA glycosylase family protein